MPRIKLICRMDDFAKCPDHCMRIVPAARLKGTESAINTRASHSALRTCRVQRMCVAKTRHSTMRWLYSIHCRSGTITLQPPRDNIHL